MSYCTCLTCVTAAFNGNDRIKLIYRIGRCKRLTNDNLKRLQSKIIINVSLIDSDLTFTRY